MSKEKKEKEFVLSPEEYKALKEKAGLADQHFDKLLRLQAEAENIKKRLAKEKEEFIKLANKDLIAEFVSILDDFQLAIESAEKSPARPENSAAGGPARPAISAAGGYDAKLLLEGVKMITKHLQDVLKNQGLSVIDKTGIMFDHDLHEAVATIETDEFQEDTVVEILRKGYMINGRVIRPAIVKVSKKKPVTSNQKPDEEKEEKQDG